MKKCLALILCLSLVGCGSTKASSTTKTEEKKEEKQVEVKALKSNAKSLKAYAKELNKKDSKKNKYYYIGKANQKVLLVTNDIMKDDDNHAVDADVYIKAEDGFKYITHVNSHTSGQPVIVSNGYIYTGSHHWSSRLTIKDDKGVEEHVEDILLDKDEIPYTKYSIENNIKTELESKTIKETDDLDYYNSVEYNPAKFKAIK